jgi:xylulokinase
MISLGTMIENIYFLVNQQEECALNPFAHVNHSSADPRLRVLVCINGTGIMNSQLRKNVAANMSYTDINDLAAKVSVGSDGVAVIPFDNGSDRILKNKEVGNHFWGLDINRYWRSRVLLAAQEGVAFSFKYGVDIMKEIQMNIQAIRAGHANMFLSPVFRQILANTSGTTIKLYETDGAQDSARGPAVGAGLFASSQEAFKSSGKTSQVTPSSTAIEETRSVYESWLSCL